MTATRKTSTEPGSWRARARHLLRGARTRILAAVIGLLVVSTLAFVFLSRQLLLAQVDERVDASLVQEAEEFRRLAAVGRNPTTGDPFGDDVEAIFEVFLQRNVAGEGENFFTFVDGEPSISTAPDSTGPQVLAALPELGAITAVRRGDIEIGERVLRYLAVPVILRDRQRGVFAVSADIGREKEEVTEALQTTTWVALGVLLLASAVAFVAAGRVLRRCAG